MSLFGDIASGLTGIANTAYNLFTNKRDFDYQKALQQEVFNREDTAVQRRMEDLRAAGLNPNLAAGSAAQSGAVVTRSNTNDVNMGSALDMLQAVNSIRQQKQQTENAKVENQILQFEKEIKDNERLENYFNLQTSLAETMYMLGLPVKVNTITFRDNEGGLSFVPKVLLDDSDIGEYTWHTEKPLLKNLDYSLNYNKNAADIMEKDNNWYVGDKIAGYGLGLLGLGNSFSGFKKAFKK